jgi:hypothetical protein
MSQEGKDVLGVMAGAAIIICFAILLLTPNQMRQCVQLGYEWIDGDCVMGATYD